MSQSNWTGHWLSVQLSALALIPLTLFLLASFALHVAPDGGYENAIAWVQRPANGLGLILLFVIGVYYCSSEMVSGLVYDYVHDPVLHVIGYVLVKFFSVLLLIDGVAAVLKIMFGS